MYGQDWEDTAMVTLQYPSGVFATLVLGAIAVAMVQAVIATLEPRLLPPMVPIGVPNIEFALEL